MVLVEQLSLHEDIVKVAIKSTDHKGFKLILSHRLEVDRFDPLIIIFVEGDIKL